MGLYKQIIDEANVVVYDITTTPTIGEMFEDVVRAAQKLPPPKSMTEVLIEVVERFETEEEKMNFLRAYEEQFIPALAKGLDLI